MLGSNILCCVITYNKWKSLSQKTYFKLTLIKTNWPPHRMSFRCNYFKIQHINYCTFRFHKQAERYGCFPRRLHCTRHFTSTYKQTVLCLTSLHSGRQKRGERKYYYYFWAVDATQVSGCSGAEGKAVREGDWNTAKIHQCVQETVWILLCLIS